MSLAARLGGLRALELADAQALETLDLCREKRKPIVSLMLRGAHSSPPFLFCHATKRHVQPARIVGGFRVRFPVYFHGVGVVLPGRWCDGWLVSRRLIAKMYATKRHDLPRLPTICQDRHAVDCCRNSLWLIHIAFLEGFD